MSLQQNLRKLIVKITYIYSLILGISPGSYDFRAQKFKVTKWYLVYSAFIQLLFLSLTPLSSPYFKRENTFMDNKPTLQWTYLVGKAARILTIVIFSGKIWLDRWNLIKLYELHQRFSCRHQYFLQSFCHNFQHEVGQEQQRIQQFMFYKFLSLHLSPLIVQILFLSLQRNPGWNYFLMVAVNAVQTFYLLVGCMQLTLILCEIHLTFLHLNKALEILPEQNLPYHFLLEYYLIIYKMYVQYHQLCRLELKACNAFTLFMLIKMFTTNIVLLYHAVLILTGSIPSNIFIITVGFLSIVIFYWDIFLFIAAVDRALTSCEYTVEILKSTWFTLEEVNDFKLYRKLTRVLNQLSDYLACNKLKFCIYGLVNFDKASSFQYFIAAILHLIILVQFDLQNKLHA